MKNFIDEITNAIQRSIDSGSYYFTIESLKHGNHFLEINLHGIYTGWDSTAIIIGYLYDGQFWKNRREVFNKRGFWRPDTLIGKTILTEDFKIIQNNLLIESEKCDRVLHCLNDWHIDDLLPSLEYMYYGNCIISHEVDGAHADLDVEDLSIVYNSDQIPKSTRLEIEGDWVRSLDEETQKCVDNYNNLCKVDNTTIDTLLMPLYKAIENEYRKFYLYNIEEILVSAKDLIKETEKWSNRDKKRLGLLYKNCSTMIKNRDKYRPGGLGVLHTLLYHLGLCNGLPVGTKNISFLSEDDLKLVKKFEHLIASLQRMAAERNKIIHDPSLGEENEPSPFDRTRHELTGLLKLFSKFDYKKVNNI